jgi:hypothetical protein
VDGTDLRRGIQRGNTLSKTNPAGEETADHFLRFALVNFHRRLSITQRGSQPIQTFRRSPRSRKARGRETKSLVHSMGG